jgi:hypothetical protein
MNESKASQPQLNISTPLPVASAIDSGPSCKVTLSAQYQDRLERLRQPIEQAGEYAQPGVGVNQSIPTVSNGVQHDT